MESWGWFLSRWNQAMRRSSARVVGPCEVGEGGGDLGLHEGPFHGLVALLEVDAGGVDPSQDRGVLAEAHLALEALEIGLSRAQGVHVFIHAGNAELRLGPGEPATGEKRGQVGLHPLVIGAVARQQVNHPRAFKIGLGDLLQLLETPEGHLHESGGVIGPDATFGPPAQVVGGAIPVDLPQCQQLAAVGTDPTEGHAEAVGVVTQTSPEDEGVHAETADDLGHLGHMTEGIRVVGDRGFLAELAADPASEQEVANQRLLADELLVGEDIGGTYADAPLLDQTGEPFPGVWPGIQIVLQDDGLPIQCEAGEGGGRLQGVHQFVHRAYQTQPDDLEGYEPLPIPVGVGHYPETDLGRRLGCFDRLSPLAPSSSYE